MFKVMISTQDSNDAGSCIKDEFHTEANAWAWWDIVSDDYPEMVGVWVETVTANDEFFRGWDDEAEMTDAWDGLQ